MDSDKFLNNIRDIYAKVYTTNYDGVAVDEHKDARRDELYRLQQLPEYTEWTTPEFRRLVATRMGRLRGNSLEEK